MTRPLTILAALLIVAVGCSPATTQRLCDVSGLALDLAQPENPDAKLAQRIGRFMQQLLCRPKDAEVPTSIPHRPPNNGCPVVSGQPRITVAPMPTRW